LLYVICFPSVMLLISILKILRYSYFPSPIQLFRGFQRQWSAIDQGPVVTRVHRNKDGADVYTTVAHESRVACDTCAQPFPVLIETDDGQWICGVCAGEFGEDELWRAAAITLMGDDGL
jgi:hypothetical protein